MGYSWQRLYYSTWDGQYINGTNFTGIYPVGSSRWVSVCFFVTCVFILCFCFMSSLFSSFDDNNKFPSLLLFMPRLKLRIELLLLLQMRKLWWFALLVYKMPSTLKQVEFSNFLTQVCVYYQFFYESAIRLAILSRIVRSWRHECSLTRDREPSIANGCFSANAAAKYP